MTARGLGRQVAVPLATLTVATVPWIVVALLLADGFAPRLYLGLGGFATFVAAGGIILAFSSRAPVGAEAEPSVEQIESIVSNALTHRELGRFVFDMIDEGVIVLGEDLTIAAANPASRRIFSFDREALGQPVREVVPFYDERMQRLGGSADPLANAVASRRKAEATLYVRDPDGEARPIYVAVLPVEGRLDGARRYIMLVRDQSLPMRHARATAELIAGVVHDLRTPLTALQGFAELLLEQEGVSESARREWTGLVHSEAARMGAMVDDILDLTRMQRGRARIHCGNVQVHELTDAAVAGARADTHTIEVEWADPPGSFHADMAKVVRALTNLVQNAVKYSPSGTRVQLRVASTESGLTFEVRDHGPGIPEAERERIFEPFYRGWDWDNRQAEVSGSGLGLSIARTVARLHDGDVTVRNHPDGGAVFTLTINEPRACPHLAGIER